jgi:hypothetical protein
VVGRRIDEGWWAYEVKRAATELDPEPRPAPEPMSRHRLARLTADLPRCAQRARSLHGGDFKVAWPTRKQAEEVAVFTRGHAYRCQLVAPAIGEHWHVSSSRKKGRR